MVGAKSMTTLQIGTPPFSLLIGMLLNLIQELDEAPRNIRWDRGRDITIVYRARQGRAR